MSKSLAEDGRSQYGFWSRLSTISVNRGLRATGALLFSAIQAESDAFSGAHSALIVPRLVPKL